MGLEAWIVMGLKTSEVGEASRRLPVVHHLRKMRSGDSSCFSVWCYQLILILVIARVCPLLSACRFCVHVADSGLSWPTTPPHRLRDLHTGNLPTCHRFKRQRPLAWAIVTFFLIFLLLARGILLLPPNLIRSFLFFSPKKPA